MNGLGEINAVAMLFMAGVLLISGILMLRAHRHFRQQPRRASEAAAGLPAATGVRGVSIRAAAGGEAEISRIEEPFEHEQWEVRMHETARSLSATLDSKMVVLEHLIREADRAAARLEAAFEGLPAKPPEDGVAAPASGNSPVSVSAPSFEKLPAAVQLTQAAALGQGRPAAGAADGGERARTTGDSVPGDRYQELYVLADYGYPAGEIARRVGMPAGEVELILSLRGVR